MKLSLSRTVDTRLDTRGRGKKYRREEKNRGIGEGEKISIVDSINIIAKYRERR